MVKDGGSFCLLPGMLDTRVLFPGPGRKADLHQGPPSGLSDPTTELLQISLHDGV